MTPELSRFIERAFKGLYRFLDSGDHRQLKRMQSKAVRRMRRSAKSVVEYMVIHENERVLKKVRKLAKLNARRNKLLAKAGVV